MNQRPYRQAWYIVEILAVAIWACYVGRVMLNTDRFQNNIGGDYPSAYGRFFWDRLASCGVCALWSGQIRGGTPSYIDSNADVFHPAVAIPGLIGGTSSVF